MRVVVAVIVIGMPSYAHAGIFSFVAGLFNKHEEQQTASVVTSQNIQLLQASLSPDPNLAKGGGDITVVGDVALLPETGPSGTMADIEETHSSTISLYVVREGDTLSQVAKMFGVSVNTIMWANDTTPRTIHPGDQLIILPVSGTQHVVKSGDTLQSIAKKYKADVREIIQYNNLKENETLAVGTNVIIPDGEGVTVQTSVATGAKTPVRGASGPNLDYYYAAPLSYYRKSQGLHGYNGVDLAAPNGTPVVASASGTVIVSKNYGWNGGYGEYVVISHPNGTQTLYSHLSGNVTYSGMQVFKGQVIGYVGSTGKSTGPHLHFEVRGAKNPF
ncbi:MAG: M23 family metallopeptidase [Candidatus Taylorbacteria bacterium]|nr:M23 family metallopeptidase [Candidatus Taylorbacteria bacterium]